MTKFILRVACPMLLFGLIYSVQVKAEQESVIITADSSQASSDNSDKQKSTINKTPLKTTKPVIQPIQGTGPKPMDASSAVNNIAPGNLQAAAVQVQPSTGSAGLSIPIQVPPGRAGIQPNLELVYNSSNRQLGNAGVGWGLDLGSIQRSTKNGVPTYDDTKDTFTMEQNGSTQDLVPDATTSGLYHLVVETAFARIQYYNTYWVVTDTKGTKYYYGNDGTTNGCSSGCIQNDPANPSHIFRWALSRVEDVFGNYMTISYLQDNGQLYPQTIIYTGNNLVTPNLPTYATVNIIYSGGPNQFPAASQPSLSYISKFLVETAQRINQITVAVGGNVQSTYNFNYVQSANTQRDLLQSVQQTGADGQSTLPAVTFTYNEAMPQWQKASGWTIPSAFTLNYNYNGQNIDAGVRILDLNGDGYPDFISSFFTSGISTSQQSGTYLNNADPNNLGWASSSSWNISPDTLPFYYVVNMGSAKAYQGALIADLNGDGLADIIGSDEIVNSSSQPLCGGSYFGINMGNAISQDTSWSMPQGVSFFKENYDGQCVYNCTQVSNGTLLGDVLGNGYPDLVQSIGSTQGVYINQYPQGSKSFSQDSSFTFPSGGNIDFTQGATLLDLNGDGLADIFYLKGGTAKAYVNNGSGWVENTGYESTFSVGDLTDQSTEIVDVNGDGLPDLVITTNGDRANATILLNTGSGWVKYQGNIGDFNFFDHGTQFLDANADGMAGYLTYENGSSPELYLNANKPADLLISVNNGIGAQTSITYDSDFHSKNTYMPYFMPVVQSTTTTVGSQSYTTKYKYAGGLWDKTYREFDGFSTVTVTDPENNYVTTTYLQGHWTNGLATEQDTYDSNNNLYTKIVNTWQTQTIVSDASNNPLSEFPYLARTDNYFYDGNSSATPKRTAQEYTYTQPQGLQNVYLLTATTNDGQVDPSTGISTDPNITVTQVYYINNTTNWIIGLPSETVTQDINNKPISKTELYYDNDTSGTQSPSLGELTAKVNWLGISGQPDPKTTYTYDSYGNLLTTTDPNNNTTNITYDNYVYMFPVEETNALGQKIIKSYYGLSDSYPRTCPPAPMPCGGPLTPSGLTGLWGQLESTTDPNNQTSSNTYDTFGRPVNTISPLDKPTSPTGTTSYNIQSNYIAVTNTARVSSGSSATIKSISFYDGLGRLMEEKSLSQTPGQFIVSDQTVYDDRGLPVTKYLPYFTKNPFNVPDAINTSLPAAQVVYDPMGRVITNINPDATTSRTNYNQWTITTTDENGHQQISYLDAFGRLVKKEEYKGADGHSSYYPSAPFTLYATTQYAYDPKGNLTSVTDDHGNVTTIGYDNLSRKIFMTDPDMGTWHYAYDGNGNIIDQQDAKGKVIGFQYDALNRLKNRTDAISGPIVNLHALLPQAGTFNVNYGFDDKSQDFGIGRLGSANYDNGSAGFIYDQIGREVNSSKSIYAANYNVQRQYDDLNRLKQVQYPDNSQVVYSYNLAGQIISVADSQYNTRSSSLVELLPRKPRSRAEWIEENVLGVSNAYAISGTSSTARPLANMYVKNVTYNASGQMTQIQYGNGIVTGYSYYPDNLRLKEIHTSNGKNDLVQDLVYTYDSVGQVLTITDNANTGLESMTQSFAYDELNRLVSAAGVYGTRTYAYDSIGNITQKDGLTYTYGGNGAGPNAVTSLSDGTVFTYDANGNMVSMQKGNNLTQYLYDTQNRLQTVMVGGLKVASYIYDGDGGRAEKIVYRRDLALYNDNTNALLFGNNNGMPLPATAKNLTVDRTIYVGNLYETDSNGTSGSYRGTKFIYFGNTRVASVDDNGNVFYYHSDALGSTNVLTDQTGQERELTEYDPFGQVILHQIKGNDFNRAWYYFTNKPLDDETGLIFLGSRYYNPTLGRFITPDTTVQAPNNPQTLNRYSYCNNNPVNLIDPTGHSWFSHFFKDLWHSIEHVFGYIVGAIAGIVAGVLTQNFMVGFQVFNAVSSVVNAGISGNWGGFAGSLVGGAIGGYLGGALGGAIVQSWAIPMSAATFGQGFAVGAVEMGFAGFGSGFGGGIGSGQSIGQAFRAGAIGGAIGAVTGGLMEGSYVKGWQGLFHGEDQNEWNAHAWDGFRDELLVGIRGAEAVNNFAQAASLATMLYDPPVGAAAFAMTSAGDLVLSSADHALSGEWGKFTLNLGLGYAGRTFGEAVLSVGGQDMIKLNSVGRYYAAESGQYVKNTVGDFYTQAKSGFDSVWGTITGLFNQ